MKTAIVVLVTLTLVAVPTLTETAMTEGIILSQKVTVTAYTKYESCSNKPNCLTASGKPVTVGYAAMSRDLERKGLRFGDIIYLIGIGHFVIEDRMHRKWKNKIDIYMGSFKQAKEFGIKRTVMVAKDKRYWVAA